MTDTFSDKGIREAVKKEAGEARGARASLTETIESANVGLAETNANMNKMLEALQAQDSEVVNKIDTTLEQADLNSSIPKEVRDLLGVFDTRFNDKAVAARLTQQQHRLSAINRKRQNVVAATTARVSEIESKVRFAGMQAQSETRDLTELIAVEQFGFQMEDQKHKNIVRKLQGASEAELKEIITEKKEAGIPRGLIEAELMLRKGKKLGIDSQSLSNEAQRVNVTRMQRDDFLASKTPDELKALATNTGGKNPEFGALGITQNHILEAIQKKELRNVQFKSLQLANRAKDVQTTGLVKQSILTSMSSRQLSLKNKEAAANGGKTTFAEAPDITFTVAELQAAIIPKRELERKNRDILANELAIQKSSEVLALANQKKVDAITNVTGVLPPEVNIALALANTEAEIAKSMGASPQMRMEQQLKATAVIDAYEKEIIDGTSKIRKPGIKNFLANGGKAMTDTGAAADFVIADAFNPAAFATNDIMARPWQGLAFQMAKEGSPVGLIADESGAIDTADLTAFLTQTKGKKSPEELLNKAALSSKFRTNVGLSMFSNLLVTTIAGRSGDVAEFEKQGLNPWGLLWDHQRGGIKRDVTDANGNISLNKLNKYVSDVVNPQLRKQGFLAEGETFQKNIILTMRNSFPEFYATRVKDSSPEFAAIDKALFNNKMPQSYYTIQQQFQRAVEQSEKNTLFSIKRDERERNILGSAQFEGNITDLNRGTPVEPRSTLNLSNPDALKIFENNNAR